MLIVPLHDDSVLRPFNSKDPVENVVLCNSMNTSIHACKAEDASLAFLKVKDSEAAYAVEHIVVKPIQGSPSSLHFGDF